MMHARMRDREELEGIDGDRFERIDLLGDFHRAKLSADPRTDAAGDEQARGKRSSLANQGNRQSSGDHRLGAKTLERCPGMHRQHDANREAGKRNQRKRTPAHLKYLAPGFLEFVRRKEDRVECAAAEQRHVANPRKQIENEGSEAFEHAPALCNGQAELRR